MIERSIIARSETYCEIWNERGRWLGSEYRLDWWFTPFSDQEGEGEPTKTVTLTAAFSSKQEAQAWVSEFDNARAVARVKAAGGTKLVIVT